MTGISYEARIWQIHERPDASARYRVRWKVTTRRFNNGSVVKSPGRRVRAQVLEAARKGESFNTETALPHTMAAAIATCPAMSTHAARCGPSPFRTAQSTCGVSTVWGASTPEWEVGEGRTPFRSTDCAGRQLRLLSGWSFRGERI
ncbi:MAG: hypothetical protein J2P35_09920, partial [Actinobacteria bacterium]|nr:hypothetical protein [Actinomycetota bacterium]